MNYGKGLMDIRQSMGLTTDQFAVLCGITSGDVFKIEENCEDVTKEEVKKICEGLEIPPTLYYFLCVEREDVKEEKWVIFDAIAPVAKQLTIDVINKKAKPDFDPLIKAIKGVLDEHGH